MLICRTFCRLVAILGQASYKTPKGSIWLPFHILLKLIINVAMLWWYMTNKQSLMSTSFIADNHSTIHASGYNAMAEVVIHLS